MTPSQDRTTTNRVHPISSPHKQRKNSRTNTKPSLSFSHLISDLTHILYPTTLQRTQPTRIRFSIYTPLYRSKIWRTLETMTTFLSLPLELRNRVYSYALSDGHDVIHDGLPSLYKVHPEITTELYSYRDLVIAISVLHDPVTDDEPPPLLERRLLHLTNEFAAKKLGNRSLIVLLIAVAEKPTFRRPETLQHSKRCTCAADWINHYNFSTTMKACQWAKQLMALGIDARLDRRTVRTRRDPPFEEPPPGVAEFGTVWY